MTRQDILQTYSLTWPDSKEARFWEDRFQQLRTKIAELEEEMGCLG